MEDQDIPRVTGWAALPRRRKIWAVITGLHVALILMVLVGLIAMPLLVAAAIASLIGAIVIGVCYLFVRAADKQHAKAASLPAATILSPLSPSLPLAPVKTDERTDARVSRRADARARRNTKQPLASASPDPATSRGTDWGDDDRDFLGPIINSSRAGQYLTFEYADRHGEVTERVLSKWTEHIAYVAGHCARSNGMRTFRKDRVEAWHDGCDRFLKRP